MKIIRKYDIHELFSPEEVKEYVRDSGDGDELLEAIWVNYNDANKQHTIRYFDEETLYFDYIMGFDQIKENLFFFGLFNK